MIRLRKLDAEEEIWHNIDRRLGRYSDSLFEGDTMTTGKKLPEFAELEDGILKAVLTIMQEGICFLSKDLDVLYANPAMKFWYEFDENSLGRKCYESYHNRTEPCENCPILRSIKTGQPESGEQVYEKNNKREGWQKILCVPFFDPEGNIMMVIEYVHDISLQTRSELSLELMQKQIDALMELMTVKEEEARSRERQLVGNMNKSIDTVLQYLDKMLDTGSFELIRRQLELTRYGVDKDTALAVKLSGQELMIARYIAQGFVSKEIADKMNLSKKTVDYHRTNIRKKLELKADDNLKEAVKEFLIKNGM